MRVTQAILMGLFALALLFGAVLRLSGFEETLFTPLAGHAGAVFIGSTVLFAVLLSRAGVDLQGLGFAAPLRLWHVFAALGAVACLQVYAHWGDPVVTVWLTTLGFAPTGYAEDHFAALRGDTSAFVTMLIVSWVFAAVGEEVSFRVVLLQGLASALGQTAVALVLALIISAMLFGAIHLYKGPPGMLSSAISGLAFGLLVIAARGAIWPAILAHGLNNSLGLWAIYSGW